MEKLNITLPKEILEKLDQFAKKWGISRSEAIRLIVLQFFREE